MVTRGFNQNKPSNIKSHLRLPSNGSDSGSSRLGHKAPVPRIMLPSSVYLDMLNLAYFAIHNGFGSEGLKLARAIEYRAKYDSVPTVILVSRAVTQLAESSGGNIVEAPAITVATPSVLTKNMITNASFRTKKLEGDIPRVETEDEAATGERMGVISEEAETEVEKSNKNKENEAVVDGVDKVNIADKIKAKMENVRDNVRIPTRKKEKEREKDKD